MPAPAWLTARPIAHRGLHDAAEGVIENTLAAARAAMAGGYAVECDVTLSSDGEAMVFHDDDLGRLTGESGPVRERSAVQLGGVTLGDSGHRIPTLGELLATIGGRVPLICEIKSAFDGSLVLARRAAEVAASYAGPLAFKSFDPVVVAALAQIAPDRPRGMVAESRYDDPDWSFLPPRVHRHLVNFLYFPETRPDFLSWYVKDLETPAPVACRHGMGLPVMTWTVRTQGDLERARAGADQIVFEGFRP